MTPLALTLCLFSPAEDIRGTVVHVSDGNTLRVRPEGSRRPVEIRLIGLDAPKKATRDFRGQEPWGTRAQQFLALAATRKAVRVEFDVVVPVTGVPAARWGYVWLGDRLLNADVLAEGHGVLVTAAPNVKYVERLRDAQRDARQAGKGVWDPAEPLTEEPGKFVARRQADAQERQAAEDAVALPAWRQGCVIGNNKSKVYHKPGGRYYESSKESKNAVFFATAEDAEKAGYKGAAR